VDRVDDDDDDDDMPEKQSYVLRFRSIHEAKYNMDPVAELFNFDA